jgi:hypothetical protein
MEICDENDEVVHGFIFYLSLDINRVDKSHFCLKNIMTKVAKTEKKNF